MPEEMSPQPLPDLPALLIGDAVVISDLHIGMETKLKRKGFHIVSRTGDMISALMSCPEECRRLVILGDVKDTVPGRSRQEYLEIPAFFGKLMERYDRIDIVKGNHDTDLEEFVPFGIRIHQASGMVMGDTGLVHGHTWPSEEVMRCRTLVMAHEHPAVMFRDGVGRHMTEPCWVRGEIVSGGERYPEHPDRFVIVPAFNRLLGGSPVNVIDGEFLSPIINSGMTDLDSSEIYLLDGIFLGKRADLMVRERDTNRRRR
ncbi:MAG: metallophosphoesterase [Candidatus Methanomethylophilaceae archaeon]|nr:metallophosphoesterase [Candidatus Methanomethylophilaceae archaeon]